MKKAKRRTRLWSVLLALVMITLYAVPAFAAVIPEETAEPQTGVPRYLQPLTSYETEHSYDEGIIDGAVYYLRNVYHNTYMDVDGANPANTTEVSTYTFHGGTNQQFKFFYLGDGIYEIVAMHSGTNLHINAQGALIIYAKNRNMEQRFRVQMLDNMTGVIFTQFSGYSQALCFDVNDPNSVVQKTYSTLSNKTQAQWVFERVDTTTVDRYANFYIRHFSTGHYIDVIERGTTEGTTVHGTTTFHGSVNQEWKTYYDWTDGCYYLKPGHRRDMAMDYSWDHVIIRNDVYPSTQSFQIMQSDALDADTGKPLYAIRAQNNTYLTLGGALDGSNMAYCYIDTTTTATYCWILEGVPHDATDPGVLMLNTWQTGIVEPGYQQEQPFYFTPEKTSRYKVELKDGNVDFGSIVSETMINAEVSNRKTYNGIRVADVFFQAGVTYCIPVYSKNAVDGSTTGFSIRVRQLTAVAHSSNDEDGNTADFVIWPVDRLIENDMNFCFLHREDMTVQHAEQTTVTLTGYRDFNSEIFIYAGHGLYGNACYDGTNIWNSFDANALPDMSNCELAIWACCNSASPTVGDSMGSVSYENGAKVVFAWKGKIKNKHLECFLFHLFNSLSGGATIFDAKNYALTKLMQNTTYEASEIEDFVDDIQLYGNEQFVLHPIATNNMLLQNSSVVASAAITSPNDYTLVAENDSVGWKMYARMINGIMVDDYYIEFYDGEKLVNVKKSCNTMTNADVVAITTQINQYVFENSSVESSTNAESFEYVICYVSNEWRLMKKAVAINKECDCCMEYTYYDALTGEVILQ